MRAELGSLTLAQLVRIAPDDVKESADRSCSQGESAMVLKAFKMVLLVGSVIGLLEFGSERFERVAWAQETSPNSKGKPVDAPKATAAEAAEFRLYDGFDGKLALDWEVIRPNPKTASLTKNPGRLTLTSEYGGLHAENYGHASANNVYVIPSPAKDGDFVVTTCFEHFHPDAPYQQAGPLIYDDDKNYFKAVIGCNHAGTLLGANWEFNGAFLGQDHYVPDLKWDRLWLRIIKRGTAYEVAYSTDGKAYTVVAEKVWDNSAPTKVGLAVMNENGTSESLDAAFDFFEVRSLTSEERNDPAYLERQKLQGMWEVVSSQVDGEPLAESSASRFTFSGPEVTFAMLGQSLRARYTLDVSKSPKALRIYRGYDGTLGTLAAIYRMDQDRLTLCMNLQPDSPAPTAFESKADDGRLLITLQRMPAVKAAALTRNAEQRKASFARLDRDRDNLLAREELLADYPSAEAVKQGTEIFDALDGDRDGKLSLEEFNKRPRKVQYLSLDLDADGQLACDELAQGEMPRASEAYAAKVFARRDRNDDGKLSYEEYSQSWYEGAFFKMDIDQDERISLGEFQVGMPRLTKLGHVSRVFDSLDRDENGRLDVEEFCKRSPESHVLDRDEDGDSELTVAEWCRYCTTAKEREAAEKDFAGRDADNNGRLTVAEYAASLKPKQ